MLVLTRKEGQEIVLDGRIRITVVKIKGETIQIGVDAPRAVGIARSELLRKEPQAA